MSDGDLKTTPWDAADYIETQEDVLEFLKVALEENDPVFFADALGVIARAKGLTAVAQRAGLSREALDQTLSATTNPGLSAFLKIIEAMDLRLDVRAREVDTQPAG